MATNRPALGTILSTGSVASEVSMLFRTKRVSEIRGIEQKIRDEAEDKSDSLRELLGTRYKDLLRAADEITVIRDASSKSVCEALREMAKSSTRLREHFSEKSGRDANSPAPITDDLERRKKVHIIGSRLKHIVDSPEVLYAHLEAGDVYEAAVRYFLASRNYQELRSTQGLEGVANRFAERRWEQVQVFKVQVLAAAEKKLVTPGSEPNVYAKALASLVILSGDDRDIAATAEGMLASRLGWIDDQNRSSAHSVQVKMRGVASIVSESISCMSKMFWDIDSGVETLLRIVDVVAANEVKELRETGTLKSICSSWIGSVEDWLKEHSEGILASADTSRVLADTLHVIDDVFEDDDWSAHCKSTLGCPPKVVLDIFTHFISKRAAAVASESVQKSVDEVLSDVDRVWTDIDSGSHMGKLLWSTISSQALKWNAKSEEEDAALTTEAKQIDCNEDDIIRNSVRDGPVSTVLDVFESKLSEALRDGTNLTRRIPSVSQAFGNSVRQSLPRVLDGLRGHLESIPMTFSDDPASTDPSCEHIMEKALFIARIAAALGGAEFVRSAYSFRDSIADAYPHSAPTANALSDAISHGKSLEVFRHMAFDLSDEGYKTWANRLCSRLKDQLYEDLVNEEALLVKTGWASVSESIDDEEGRESKHLGHMQYPTSASTAASKLVLRACRFANRAGGFALPERAIYFLRDEMSSAVNYSYGKAFKFYSENCGGERNHFSSRESDEPETAIIQMLFDIFVLEKLLYEPAVEQVSRSLKSGLKGIEQQLQAAIDPINFTSCKRAMYASVDAYFARTSVMFGTITRSGVGKPSNLKRPLTMSTQSASSNLVPMSRTVQRFTYLPAPMPSTYTTAGVGTAGLSAKAALGALRSEAAAANGSTFSKREVESSVAEYASKVSESVGRFGRGFFESWTRKTG